MNVTLELTDAQVCELVASAFAERARLTLLSGLSGLSVLREQVTPFLRDSGCSTEALRAVLVYAAFPVDGSERAVTDIAAELGFSTSTSHRYISSWVAVGLLRQDPQSRRYRRATPVPATRGCGDAH